MTQTNGGGWEDAGGFKEWFATGGWTWAFGIIFTVLFATIVIPWSNANEAERKSRRQATYDTFKNKCEGMGGLHVTVVNSWGPNGQDCRFPKESE